MQEPAAGLQRAKGQVLEVKSAGQKTVSLELETSSPGQRWLSRAWPLRCGGFFPSGALVSAKGFAKRCSQAPRRMTQHLRIASVPGLLEVSLIFCGGGE